MRIEVAAIAVQQPIGTFYVSAVPAEQLLKIVTIKQRILEDPTGEGVQRQLSTKRINEIALYTSDPDATFPTPIIIACTSETVEVGVGKISFDDELPLGEVIDGQHRVRGLQLAMASKPSPAADFVLPVVFMLDLEPYDKAYVFSTINSKQTPVPKSLIYDLFELAQARSPIKTCHEIARALNAKPGPFYKGLKMLGKRTAPTEYLTQGSFVTNLVARISRKPQADEIDVKLVRSCLMTKRFPSGITGLPTETRSSSEFLKTTSVPSKNASQLNGIHRLRITLSCARRWDLSDF